MHALQPVSLLGLATAVPPHVIDQQMVARRAPEVFAALLARNPRLIDIFANAGVARRFSVRPVAWFEQPQGWPERTEAYLDGAGALYAAAASAVLQRAGVDAKDIGTVVTVSSTGIATPSLETRVAKELGLRPDAARVPVFGLGCAGGVTGLGLAAKLARAKPGELVLFVTVELCTLAFRRDRCDKTDLVALALFGDGAAAAVL
jgi:alkylresorcinol/alkylpyrone synthase